MPLAAATFVLFQLYVPVQSGLLNVNLADPVAIFAAALFVFNAVKLHHLPRWRMRYANIAIAVATLALTVSLLVGASHFGWTTWALVNRYLCWFILLAYGATGALIVTEGGKDALRVLNLTFAGATAAVAAVEIIILLLHAAAIGLPLRVVPDAIEGFSQNHNFLAFQLLMALAATMVSARGVSLRISLLTLLVAGLWFSGSRSGWIAFVFLAASGVYLRVATGREILTAISCAGGLIAVTVVFGVIAGQSIADVPMPQIGFTEASITERLISIVGGLKLFLEHPILGAGLGAFRNEMIMASSGIPLLIHSTAVWLLAELGVLGLMVFMVPAVYLLVTEWRRVRDEPSSALIVLCLVAFAVMSAPADMLYQRTFWLLIGAGLAMESKVRPLGLGARQAS